MTKSLFSFAALLSLGIVSAANAATVTTSTVAITNPGPEAVAAGAPSGGQVHKFFLTSDADILSVRDVFITFDGGGQLFNVAPPFGSNVEPPDAAFIGFNRALEADSWITTPGATSLLGTGFPQDGTGSWGDLTNDGPKTNFQFAQLTIPAGAKGTFSGIIGVAGSAGPEAVSFSFPLGEVPEPASMAMAGMGLIGMIGVARRRKA